MKLGYCDETGTGEEPYAVLHGVVVDASRMHVTKADWASFLSQLSEMVGQDFQELHTRNFYPGSGIWKKLTGQQGEAEKLSGWFKKIKARSIPYQSMYPKKQRCETAELF